MPRCIIVWARKEEVFEGPNRPELFMHSGHRVSMNEDEATDLAKKLSIDNMDKVYYVVGFVKRIYTQAPTVVESLR